jgi:hypothetical protein
MASPGKTMATPGKRSGSFGQMPWPFQENATAPPANTTLFQENTSASTGKCHSATG